VLVLNHDELDIARARLSARELQVLELASYGLMNREIAERIGASVHVVKFHLAGIYRKLGVTNRTEAVVNYLRANASSDAAKGAGTLD
jgi:NarL family two-component system response regulator LiaR